MLAVLLCAEILLGSLSFDAYQVAISGGAEWFSFISWSGQFAKILVATIVFLLMGLWPGLQHHLEVLTDTTTSYTYQYYLVAQLVSFAAFFWTTSVIFSVMNIRCILRPAIPPPDNQ